MSPRSPKESPGQSPTAPSRSRRRLSGSPSAGVDAALKSGGRLEESRTEAPEDVRLFREAVRDVKPLGPSAQAVAEQPSTRPRRPRPAARFTRADRLAVLEESLRDEVIDPELASGEELVFHRAGIQSSVLRKLRRGDYRVQGEIDLHGLTVAEAKQELREFLAQALMRQWRCVRIIHGKGLRSGHRGPVLKSMVGAVLRKVGPVLAYVSARQVDGGTGAVYVLLSS
ncbi:MAG TPA: Smr/MutS family protein [Steroidobacteraceae bacterium]|nr:Smr/MutS family protein [Steroidobacteraceae bacterium]